ncbi:MAG: hypothetical protein GX326_04175, partial [Clostridiaceae bacterium]|nr:hypothetical protein [Clostridiaceae bacterium]
MNKKKNIKLLIAIFCIINLITLLIFPPHVKAETQAENVDTQKSEVIYANLDSAGQVKGVYVVNNFSSNSEGKIKDYGDYSAVESLALSGNVSQDSDLITVNKTEQSYYYKGIMENQEIPWDISIRHELDGNEISAKEIAGQSGDWKLTLTIKHNDAIKENAWAENLLLQISVNLSNNVAQDVIAENGMLAEAGSNKMITFMMMPDAEEMDFEIKAKVKDFSLPAIQIGAVPFSLDMLEFEMPNISDNEEFKEFKEATELLADGSQQFADGIAELKDGSLQLTDGLNQITDSGGQLAAGGDSLETGLRDFTGGLSKLSTQGHQLVVGAENLKNAASQIDQGFQGLSAGNELVAGSTQIQQGIEGMSAGLTQIKVEELNNAIQALSSLEEQVSQFNAQLSTITESFSQLNEGLKGIIGGLETYQSYVTRASILAGTQLTEEMIAENLASQAILQYIAGVNENALTPTIQSLQQIQASLEGQLAAMPIQDMQTAIDQLSGLSELTSLAGLLDSLDGVASLNTQYSNFHQGLVQYVGGVNSLSAGYNNGTQQSFYPGLTTYLSGISQYVGGVSTIDGHSAGLNSGMHEYNAGNKQYIAGIKEWSAGYNQFTDGISALGEPINQLA